MAMYNVLFLYTVIIVLVILVTVDMLLFVVILYSTLHEKTQLWIACCVGGQRATWPSLRPCVCLYS